MIKVLTSVFLAVLACMQVSASTVHFRTGDDVSRAHVLIYQLRFEEARQLLSKVKVADPGNLSVDFERMSILFLETFITEEDGRFKDFETQADRFLDRLDEAGSSPMKGMAKAVVYLQWSVLEAGKDEYLEAAWHLRRSYSAVFDNQKNYPGFVPDDAVNGVLQCILGAVPSDYEWLLSMVGMNGSIQKGKIILGDFLKQTNRTEYSMYRAEALFFISLLQTTLYAESKPDKSLMESLSVESVSNDLLLHAYTGILLKHEGNDEVISLLQNHLQSPGVFPLPGLYYRLGLARLRRFDERCIADFSAYINSSKGRSLYKASWQKTAWMRLIKGDIDGYKKAMANCLSYGPAHTDEDKAALQEAQYGPMPEVGLLKARLAFDGGYYANALRILNATDPSKMTEESRLERTYRMARIRQETGEVELAMSGYRLAIRSAGKSKSHYPANSAFQLGFLFEQKQLPDSARSYYLLCLSMPDHAYKNSIDQKAKAGVERVSKK